MFTQLAQMLRKGDTVTVTIAIEKDTESTPVAPGAQHLALPAGSIELRVNVFPKLFTLDGERGADRQALNTPLSVVATADELDGPTFIDTLTKFTASANTTRNTLDEVEAAHKAAADAAKTKSPSRGSAKPGAKPAKALPATKAAKAAAPEPPKEEDHNESLDI